MTPEEQQQAMEREYLQRKARHDYALLQAITPIIILW
eukprot:CAMPEP_0170169108 /NCGR_PEP_ID=MMETSP0040_2-20121228/2044_1 /TAXON_ID=641309 /ORGANISM="Lotharella oceanica, Strain CCMP622" /LENGTH=36 /DNA_ID= /DNA_START= /DNA_END= /DNA_ORIENTATION=